MKKLLFVLSIVFLISGCSQKHMVSSSVEFRSDFASENNRIAAKLYRKVYKRNLESLTYYQYLKYFEKFQAPSADGVFGVMGDAEAHLFKTKKHAFLVALYFKESKTVVCDISSTSILDKVHTFKRGEAVPPLEDLVGQMDF